MHKHICVKAVKERVAERSGPLRSHKQTVQRPHLFRYLLRAYKAICCFASFSRCVAIAIQPNACLETRAYLALPSQRKLWLEKQRTNIACLSEKMEITKERLGAPCARTSCPARIQGRPRLPQVDPVWILEGRRGCPFSGSYR